ncbi:MAG: endospore coat-associated protein yheD [Paenibacillus sp.]|nr:endospore coat-associated protein yheD [Paenibacillus sp.]
MDQRVGILLDHKMYKGIQRNKTGYEHIGLYNKAAKELHLEPFYMSLLQMGKKSALGMTYDGKRYRLARKQFPKVTHNRAITLKSSLIAKLKNLAAASLVFNRLNRFSKHRIHNIVASSPSLRAYLPRTVKYSKENLIQAMHVHSSVFIKPTSGSVGDGIIKLSRGDDSSSWSLYIKKGKPLRKGRKSAQAFIHRFIKGKSYIIQEAIPLATYNGSPYDLRVSVQRGDKGEWQVTGIVGKVAAKGRQVTNVAKGGKVRKCEELFQASGFSVTDTKHHIGRVALQLAHHLGRKLPHLADIGFDIGLDKSGNIKLIEMNGRDQRITFKKAKLTKTFYRTYFTPMQYAKYLLVNKQNRATASRRKR